MQSDVCCCAQVKLLKQIELKNKEHNDRMKSKEREMMQLKKQV